VVVASLESPSQTRNTKTTRGHGNQLPLFIYIWRKIKQLVVKYGIGKPVKTGKTPACIQYI